MRPSGSMDSGPVLRTHEDVRRDGQLRMIDELHFCKFISDDV
jgi:hypothetical protein